MMTTTADMKKTLKQVDNSDLSQNVDESIAVRLGKPADEEE